MTRNEFLQRFKLNSIGKSLHNYQHNKPLKEASVLIGLVEEDNGLHVLLTKRASHLKHHPSQVSFPGGKVEPEDKNAIATALREAQEEIGLSPDAVYVVGQLPPYQVISGYLVTPIIAIIANKQKYIKDDNEVAEIFQVPLSHFLADENHHMVVANKKGQKLNIHFMPYKHHNIWGATAAMLKDLANHLK